MDLEIDAVDDEEQWNLGNLPPRHRARLIALQALYEVDLCGHSMQTCLAWSLPGTPLSVDGEAFAQRLVSGVIQNLDTLDSKIQAFAPAWPVNQLSVVDRNVLRLAIYEIVIDTGTPPRVAINEAVEMAKYLGGESSPRFVNGVLGSIMESVRP